MKLTICLPEVTTTLTAPCPWMKSLITMTSLSGPRQQTTESTCTIQTGSSMSCDHIRKAPPRIVKKNLFRRFFISTPRVLMFSSEQQPASQDFFFWRPKPSDKPWRLMLRMLDRFSLACLALMWAVRYESEAINKDCLPNK